MGIANHREFTAYVGVDWADKKHDVCIQAADSTKKEFAVIPHQVEALDTWALSLKKRLGGPIAIALEIPRGPLVTALQKYDRFFCSQFSRGIQHGSQGCFRPSCH